MIFLIGGSGLIGSGFTRYLKEKKIPFKNLNRENKKKFFNKKCDLVIDCNGNGSKRFGINNLQEDFISSVTTVVENLFKIKFKKYLYISTCQVYENLKNKNFTKENFFSDINNINTYGFNKLIAESYVKKHASQYLIVRLPYVIGPGLKRNPFFDLLNDNKSYLSLQSKINCIHTDSIAEITMGLIKKKITGTFNIGSKNTIKISEIAKLLNLKKENLENNHQTLDINNIDFNKIKKISKLPDAIFEAKKYLKIK
tara:strand:+ start:104 stop:868 length:765 start_codon:yes stop_codon:yes gene_type:complete